MMVFQGVTQRDGPLYNRLRNGLRGKFMKRMKGGSEVS